MQKYKQTEVGLIPEDWTLEKIEDFASITTGGSDTQDRVKDGEYPFYVRSNTIERINKYSFDGEAILTSGDGVGVGKIFHYVTGKFDYHQRVYNIFNYRKDVDGKYLFFQFSSNFYNKVMSMTAKSSVDSVRREMIADMKIPLPPTVEEQKAIATALSDVDELISNLGQLITKKKAIKQGTIQQLLTPPHKGGKRLAGFEGEWLEKKFGDCLKYEQPTKYIVKSSNYEGQSQTPVLTAGKSFLLGYTDEDFGIYENLPVIIFDDFTTSKQFVNFKFKVKSSAMKLLKASSSEIDISFMFSYMNQINFSLGDDHKRRWIAEFSKIQVYMPEFKEQLAISKILADMDLELKHLETKKAKYQDIKQGMMQELLTGKTRLV